MRICRKLKKEYVKDAYKSWDKTDARFCMNYDEYYEQYKEDYDTIALINPHQSKQVFAFAHGRAFFHQMN